MVQPGEVFLVQQAVSRRFSQSIQVQKARRVVGGRLHIRRWKTFQSQKFWKKRSQLVLAEMPSSQEKFVRNRMIPCEFRASAFTKDQLNRRSLFLGGYNDQLNALSWLEKTCTSLS